MQIALLEKINFVFIRETKIGGSEQENVL